MSLNYKRDMRIDETMLDVEWLEQGQLAMKYNHHWVECRNRLTRAEETIKVIRADLTAKAYARPEKYLGEGIKATKDSVEAYYRNHPDHIAAKEEWMEALEEFNFAEVAKWEITKTRKEALQALVELHNSNYFSGPAVPHDLSEARQSLLAKRAKTSKKVGKRLKRTK